MIPAKRATLDRANRRQYTGDVDANASPFNFGCGAERVLCPTKLDVNLFGNCQRIIHIDAKVSNGALDFPVTKKKLNRA